jgi:hypothetical protein
MSKRLSAQLAIHLHRFTTRMHPHTAKISTKAGSINALTSGAKAEPPPLDAFKRLSKSPDASFPPD